MKLSIIITVIFLIQILRLIEKLIKLLDKEIRR